MIKSTSRFLLKALRPWPSAALNVLTGGSIVVVFVAGHFANAGRWPLIVAVLCIAIFNLATAGIRLQLRLDAGPILRFVGVDNDTAAVVSQATSGGGAHSASLAVTETMMVVSTVSDFVRVQVVNDPGNGRGERANRVIGRIAFLDSSGELLIPEIVGRWAETPQRMETGRVGISLEEAQLDIDANGLPHPLDIAMKRTEDSHFYAFNHENSLANGLLLPKHEIDADECTVRVTLRPANGDEVAAYFTLVNEGAGEKLRLDGPQSLSRNQRRVRLPTLRK